jgi:hypothetical protein
MTSESSEPEDDLKSRVENDESLKSRIVLISGIKIGCKHS